MRLTRQKFLRLLADGDFRELFITELGWDRYKGTAALPSITVDDRSFRINAIAQRSGFQILTCEVDELPTQSLVRRIDAKLRRQAEDYICIFYVKDNPSHALWVVPLRQNEKREPVLVPYENIDQAEFLYSKLDGIEFTFDQVTNIVDLRTQVLGAFAVNSEKITKDFYSGFQKEHKAFADFIWGIDDQIPTKDNRNKQWYTSVMLNRLMFCYFIQKKGFLDLDYNYLRTKLRYVQEREGENKFFKNFYLGFLRGLFHQGLNTPAHDAKFREVYGNIPYLNGGMFDVHQLERDYEHIDIEDKAFERLFDFFDKWHWHLDTRITASGRDINPDVLGYIFEQYINDRAQMGAYYTKEDITQYIGKNCILPFLVDRVAASKAAKPLADAFSALRSSGDRYIYEAVRHGYTPDWRERIPAEISRGLITDDNREEYCVKTVNDADPSHPTLASLRSEWNTRTPEPWALPTEIWRETVERFERVDSLLSKIRKGEVASINDFITLNLDIRLWVQDMLARTEDHTLIGEFYHALQAVTILDPTCGSGAFLFAAMNILEPLYEVCIERMQEFNSNNKALFKAELAEITDRYRSNIQYFIFKSIILRNLYGVDIMVEATEIAKLRLFLKMVAVVDVDKRSPNLGLDPLPDIDFNIRCGNTLVGYANEQQLDRDLTHADDILQELANQEFKEKIEAEMHLVAKTFERFKEMQLSANMGQAEFKEVKGELSARLAALNDTLNHRLFLATQLDNRTGADAQADLFLSQQYRDWLTSHQPFHWLAEFYQIIHGNHGFDVIIGNPPYVSMNQIDYLCGDNSFDCSDLYGFVIKRVFDLLSESGRHGFIVMHNLAFSDGFTYVRRFILAHSNSAWFSFYSRIPSGLFDGSVRVRNSIYITSPKGNTIYTTRLHRWFAEQRGTLLNLLRYQSINVQDVIPMLNASELQSLFENPKGSSFTTTSGPTVFVKKTAYNFMPVSTKSPKTYDESDNEIESNCSRIKVIEDLYEYVSLLLAGKILLIKWFAYGDDFNLTKGQLTSFLFPFSKLKTEEKKKLHSLFVEFEQRLPSASQYKLNRGQKVETYNTKGLWDLTDQSDLIFLSHICDNPEEIQQLIENHIAASVISDKK